MAAIQFTGYSHLQMKERDLSEELVRSALEQPDETVPGNKGRLVAHKLIEWRGVQQLLRVVYELDDDTMTVVTAYPTSKIAKYWRGP